MAVTIRTYNNQIPARCFILWDVVSVQFTTVSMGGYQDATIGLSRKPGAEYIELGYNYHLDISDSDGTIVWEGSITGLPQAGGDSNSYTVSATGYYKTLSDLTSGWLPYYPDATDIGLIMREGMTGTPAKPTYGMPLLPGYALSLVVSLATVPNFGRVIEYEPDSPASVRTHLDELCRYGNSTDSSLQFQVWNGRVFTLSPRKPLAQNVSYQAMLKSAASYDMGFNSDTFYNRVTVKYQDFFEVLYVTENNVPMQTAYGSVFGSANPFATRIPLVREADIIDITNHGIITETQARMVARTMLARYSNDGIRMVSSSVTFDDPSSIRDFSTGQLISFAKVRAGSGIAYPDYNSLNPVSGILSSAMFIGQTTYNSADGKETLELQSEESQTLENLLSGILNSSDLEAE